MITGSIIRRFGEAIIVNKTAAKGFLQPMHHKDADVNKRPLPLGVKNGESFLLVTDAAVKEGDIVTCKNEVFEVCRSTPFYFAGELSHYEAVLRSKGGADDV